MGEKLGLNAKKPEVNRDNSDSRMRRTDHPQSVNPSVDRILFLQRTVGNQAVERLIKSGALQAKLRIGQPGDKYEQEADRVADAVMRMPEPGVQRQVEPEEEEEKVLQTKPLVDQITPLVQRQVEEEEEEEMLQAKSTEDATPEVPNDLESQINAIKGGGRPLAESERAYFEPRFGVDFSRVRVHTDTRAADSARELNAQAYTVGRDMVFGAGQYVPETTSGQRLLAHELTHVVQQRSDRGSFQEKTTIGQPGDVYEQEADKIALVEGDTVNVKNKGLSSSTALAERVQRVIDPISAAGLGIAVFGLVGSLVPYGSSGLNWRRNIGKAVHQWPAGQEPAQRHWVRDHTESLIWFSCISGLSIAYGFWDLRWNYNGADIDQAHVFKFGSSSWSGGPTGSEVNVTFEMQDASASYESGGKAAMICYISGSLDPVGAGDIDYEARVLIYADGTTRKLGGFDITRGDASDFTITSHGAGWRVEKD